MIIIDDGLKATKRLKLNIRAEQGSDGYLSARVNRLPNGNYQSILVGIVVTVHPEWGYVRDLLQEAGAEGIPATPPLRPMTYEQTAGGEEGDRVVKTA